MKDICSNCSKNAYRITSNYINNREDLYEIENNEELYNDDDILSISENMSILYNIYNRYNNIINNLYFEFSDKILICNTCREVLVNKDDIKKQNLHYILSAFKTHMYNKIIETECLDILHRHISILLKNKYHRYYKLTVGSDIFTILHDDLSIANRHFKIKSNYWKGSDYYYLKIFGVPRILMELDNPDLRDHYLSRTYDFCDSICGHPMASNGWYFESLTELINLGVIRD